MRQLISPDPELHKVLRLRAVETSRSVSELVNDGVREALAEDAEDITAFEEGAGEPLISYDEWSKCYESRVSRNRCLWPFV
jgi:hypothetical protein